MISNIQYFSLNINFWKFEFIVDSFSLQISFSFLNLVTILCLINHWNISAHLNVKYSINNIESRRHIVLPHVKSFHLCIYVQMIWRYDLSWRDVKFFSCTNPKTVLKHSNRNLTIQKSMISKFVMILKRSCIYIYIQIWALKIHHDCDMIRKFMTWYHYVLNSVDWLFKKNDISWNKYQKFRPLNHRMSFVGSLIGSSWRLILFDSTTSRRGLFHVKISRGRSEVDFGVRQSQVNDESSIVSELNWNIENNNVIHRLCSFLRVFIELSRTLSIRTKYC